MDIANCYLSKPPNPETGLVPSLKNCLVGSTCFTSWRSTLKACWCHCWFCLGALENWERNWIIDLKRTSYFFALSFRLEAESCLERIVPPMNYFSEYWVVFSAAERGHLNIKGARKDLKMNIREFDFGSRSSLGSFHFSRYIHRSLASFETN